MDELKEAPKSMLKFAGTPAEIGGQIWERMCLPAVRFASNNAPQPALQQLYIGFLFAALGSMTADFGHANALFFARTAVDAFSGMADELEGTRLQ